MPSGPVAAAIVLALAVLAGGVYLFLELRHHAGGRARDRQRDGARLPLFGTDGVMERAGDAVEPARPFPLPKAPPRAASPASNGSNGSGRHAALDPAPAFDADDFAPPAPRVSPPARPRPAFGSAPEPSAPAAGTLAPPAPTPFGNPMHAGETLRFAVPDEGTLQFLPGRLEVVSGPDGGREVRFVRTGGGDPPEVTFGRSEGPAYRHVQLMARTVSRQHASMSLVDGHWSLRNLSATNPVLLNGRALEAGEVAPLLVEGDRIEMGEVVFLFHER